MLLILKSKIIDFQNLIFPTINKQKIISFLISLNRKKFN